MQSVARTLGGYATIRATTLLLSVALTVGVLACAIDGHVDQAAEGPHASECLPFAVPMVTPALSLLGPIGDIDVPTTRAPLTLQAIAIDIDFLEISGALRA